MGSWREEAGPERAARHQASAKTFHLLKIRGPRSARVAHALPAPMPWRELPLGAGRRAGRERSAPPGPSVPRPAPPCVRTGEGPPWQQPWLLARPHRSPPAPGDTSPLHIAVKRGYLEAGRSDASFRTHSRKLLGWMFNCHKKQ